MCGSGPASCRVVQQRFALLWGLGARGVYNCKCKKKNVYEYRHSQDQHPLESSGTRAPRYVRVGLSVSVLSAPRTAGGLLCYPFLHTAPDVPESQFPLRPRAGSIRPRPGHPRRGFWFWLVCEPTAAGTSAATPVGWRRRATARTSMRQEA